MRLADAKGGESFRVVAREGPIGQVFRNIIDNARSFSPPGGAVTLYLRREPQAIIATVEDQGPGVPAENLESIFERFYTERPKAAAGRAARRLRRTLRPRPVHRAPDLGDSRGRIHAENRFDADGSIVGARFVISLPSAR